MSDISCDEIFNDGTANSHDPLIIAKRFFNIIKDRDFIDTLRMIIKDGGMGGEYASIHFSDRLDEVEMDEFDQPFQGVCFIALDEEKVTTHEVFYDLAEEAAQIFVKINPHKSQEVEDFMAELPKLRKDHLDSLAKKANA